ncbi:MAG: cytochrome c biogenesis protein CcsA [Polyangiaceae bacterium]|nr:cytochrome c biogenesis protein CcsA [Myxococcales bacterium]MCC6898248.1 cytochrome c biogenesis protein CcsA [Polyangiaceae bacterium]
MEGIATAAFYLGAAAYAAAAVLFFLDLARREGSSAAAVVAPVALGVGATLHAAHVVTASLFSRICPVESLHFSLSLSALILAGMYLILRTRFRLQAVGAVVAPLALTFLIGAQFVGAEQHSITGVSRLLLILHITANLAGVGFFLLAGAAGAFYLVQERSLKEKRPTWLTAKLPPLDALDRTEHRLLLTGFPLLTLGVVTGGFFASRLGPAGGAELLRSALGYATWILLALVLVMRAAAGWRGRRSAYGTLAGVLCVTTVILLYVIKSTGASG